MKHTSMTLAAMTLIAVLSAASAEFATAAEIPAAGPGVVMTSPGNMTGPADGDCNWCHQCTNPDLMHTFEEQDGTEVLWLAPGPCEEYQCENMIPCKEQEDQLQEEQLATLVDLIENGDVHPLLAFVTEHSGSVELLPERELLLIRGGCSNEFTQVQHLSTKQVAALMDVGSVIIAFRAD